MEFCPAFFVVPDRTHRLGVCKNFHGLDDRLHAFWRKQVADDLIPSRDGDRPVLRCPDEGGKVRLGLRDGICRWHTRYTYQKFPSGQGKQRRKGQGTRMKNPLPNHYLHRSTRFMWRADAVRCHDFSARRRKPHPRRACSPERSDSRADSSVFSLPPCVNGIFPAGGIRQCGVSLPGSGGIAQRSEQAAHNCLVHGSNPCTPRNF